MTRLTDEQVAECVGVTDEQLDEQWRQALAMSTAARDAFREVQATRRLCPECPTCEGDGKVGDGFECLSCDGTGSMDIEQWVALLLGDAERLADALAMKFIGSDGWVEANRAALKAHERVLAMAPKDGDR